MKASNLHFDFDQEIFDVGGLADIFVEFIQIKVMKQDFKL